MLLSCFYRRRGCRCQGYKNFIGYRKGADGKPEIDPEGAIIIRLIYDRFLAGDSYGGIAKLLEERGIPSPSGKTQWSESTVQSILSNEKYKGDAILNKTYITDCISKKVRKNDGTARPKYYVENNHPAIIDTVTFGRVQEEIARRAGKRKVKQVGTKTEQGKYSSKYALTELLICGECGTPYRRCTWTAGKEKKIVWRCINRLDYGKKYCHTSPSMEEGVLHRTIMAAIQHQACQNTKVLQTLRLHISMGLENCDADESNMVETVMNIEVRIAEINATFKRMLQEVSAENESDFDEEKLGELMMERKKLQQQIIHMTDVDKKRKIVESRLDEVFTILDGLKNHPIEYDDQLVLQIVECVVVENKNRIKVVFIGGLEVEQEVV